MHKPVRVRDAGGISPPIKHKARRAKDGASMTVTWHMPHVCVCVCVCV